MASGGRGPQLRKDAVTNRWVIFSPARAKRPSDFKSKSPSNPNPNPNQKCPFCIGHEHECAPEIFRLPPDNPDWKIRVIQNLYPALTRLNPDSDPVPFDRNSDANSVVLEGAGFHDVVIESPLHSIHLSDLSPLEIGDVLLAYRTRIRQIASYDSIKYVQFYAWKGFQESWCVGWGIDESLSQSDGGAANCSPVVSARLDSMKEYFEKTQKCSVCEVQGEDRLIDSSTHFISVAPFAATFPFEIWIIPRDHSPHFHEIDDETAVDLGGLLKLMLRKLSLQLDDPPFNFMIQTSPLEVNASDLSYSHWFLQIVPQLTGVGGLKLELDVT